MRENYLARLDLNAKKSVRQSFHDLAVKLNNFFAFV